MKKKFKSILLFSSILGVAAITTGAIALTSCGSNVEDSTPPIETNPDNSGNNNSGNSNSGDGNNNSGNSNSGNSNSGAGNNNSGNSNSGTGNNNSGNNNQNNNNNNQTNQDTTQDPIVIPAPTEQERAIIAKSPSLSYLYDTTKGARFILNQGLITNSNINTNVDDSNVHDLMTLCGFKSNIDPFLDNGYFADALTFTKADAQVVAEAAASTSVKVVEDPILSSKNISFYLYKNTTPDSEVVQTIAEQAGVDDFSSPDKWIKLGDASVQNIKLEPAKDVYIAVSFAGDITEFGYDVPQLFAENSDNSISSEYTFTNITSNKSSKVANESAQTTKKLNKDTFLYQLNNSKPASKAVAETPVISNKIELVLKKKEQNNVSDGWKLINPLTEGVIDPKGTQKATEDAVVGINDVVKAYTYTVLDKDAVVQYDNTKDTQTVTTSEKWFKINDKSMPFSTQYPNPTYSKDGNVNLYFLYTNGNNIDLNQLDVKTGTKLLLINNNPNKVSKVICSNSFLQYGKGNENGLQFNVGSSFGWYGRFDFTQLIRGTSMIGSNIKDFIFLNKDKVNYSFSLSPKSALTLEPISKNL